MEWIQQHAVLLGWLSLGSLILFVASAIATPLWIAHLPQDYFLRLRQEYCALEARRPSQMVILAGKNILGWTLIMAGIVMLVLPGQGLLSIFLGIMLINCPRKYQLIRWIATRPAVWHSINWIRHRAGKAPLILDPD